ncbi:MAG: TonB-dependent receptor [Oceanicaulis sp.]
MTIRRSIFAGAALLASASALPFAATAQAQDAEAAPAATRDVVTVTARRREESIQDAPIAVTAIGADSLEAIGAVDITDVQKITPNATIETARGTNSTLIAFIRGVGQQDPLWGFEPGVGLYIDDVYVARPQGAVLDIFDIERIEVLRGPQGTLYGRNTIGGAIKYVTSRLSDEPEFQAGVSVGSYNQLDTVLSGSVPLGETFALGGAVARYTRDGFGENVLTGADHYNKDILAARLSAEWTPRDDLFFRLAYDRTEDDSNAKHGYRLIPGFLGGEPVLNDVYDTRGGAGDDNSVETEGLSFTAEWQANEWLTLKSITAGREDFTSTPIDFDALPARTFDVPAFYENEQFTQEFQALFDTGRWSGVAGLYYLNGAYEGAFDVILNGALNAPTYGDVSKISLSAYADVTYEINDEWSLSVGGRYTEDTTKAAVIRQTFFDTLPSPFLGGPDRPAFATGSNFRSERTDDQFSPRVNVTYEPSEDLSLYAAYSQGFKSGGFDPRGNAGLPGTPNFIVVTEGFEPEVVDSFEVGAKGSLADGRLVYRAAAFYAQYTDQQITVQTSEPDPVTGLQTFVSTVLNAGESEYMGLELEGSAFLTDNFSIDYMLGFIDADIVEILTTQPDPVTGAPTEVDISDQYVVQNTPEYTWRLAANYELAAPQGLGDVRLTAGVSYRDDINLFNVPNTGEPEALPQNPLGVPLPALDEDTAYTLLDASVIWDLNEQWRFSLIGRNLTDERYRIAGYNFAGANQLGVDGAYSAFFGDPRTVTASVRFRY